jgi:zinc transport system ATP-binding protein
MGTNGSGKSTFLKALLGLLPLHQGSITLSNNLRRSDIGYVSQQKTVQRDFPASVLEVVLLGCLPRRGWRPYYRAAEKKMALRALERFNIAELRHTLFRNLSGGQQQRVLLVRAICSAHRLLVLDEPAKNLDEEGARTLLDVLDDLNQSRQVAHIVVTHDWEAARRCQRILYLDQGRCVFWGKPEHFQMPEL